MHLYGPFSETDIAGDWSLLDAAISSCAPAATE